MLEKGCPSVDSFIFEEAARQGSLDIIFNMKWFLENGCPTKDSHIFSEALYHGSLRNMK